MLRAVGNAVVVNPDAELARIAREEGWQVMRFEKLGRRLAIGGATLAAAARRPLLASRRAASRRGGCGPAPAACAAERSIRAMRRSPPA